MIITTTQQIEGKAIKEYLGVVAADAVTGLSLVKDLVATASGAVGGRSGAHEKALQQAREGVLFDLKKAASTLGANAVVGVNLHYCATGNSLLVVSAFATAVVVE